MWPIEIGFFIFNNFLTYRNMTSYIAIQIAK